MLSYYSIYYPRFLMRTRRSSHTQYNDNIAHADFTALIKDIANCILKHLNNKQPITQSMQNGIYLFGKKIDNGGSGDCLFKSVAYFTEGNHNALRQLTADVIRNNSGSFATVISEDAPERLETKDDEIEVTDVQSYADFMAQAGTWGGYIELYVLASILNRPIALLSGAYRPQIFRSHNTQDGLGDPIFLYYDGGTHYQTFLIPEGRNAQDIFQRLEHLANNDAPPQISEEIENKEPPLKRRKTSKGKEEEDDDAEKTLRFLNRSSQTTQPENRRLDSLARLLEGDNTCVAVCLIGNEIFVTSNKLKDYKGYGVPFDNDGAKFMMRILSYFLASNQNQNKDSHLGFLSEICLGKIEDYNNSIAAQRGGSPNVVRIQLTKDILEQIIRDLFNAPDEIQYLANNEISNYFTEDEKKVWEQRGAPDPQNRRMLLNLIDKNLQIEVAQKILWRFIRDFKKSMSFFRHNNIQRCNLLAIGAEDEHAEIRLIGYFLESGKLTAEDSTRRVIYIGLSKLCCAYCAAKIHVLNNELSTHVGVMFEENEEEKKIESAQMAEYAEEQAKSQSSQSMEEIEEEKREPSSSSSSLSSSFKPNTIETKGHHGLHGGSSWEAVPKYLSNQSYVSKYSYIKPVGLELDNPEIGNHAPIRTDAIRNFQIYNKPLYKELQTTYNKMSADLKKTIKESESAYEKGQFASMVQSPSTSAGDSPQKPSKDAGILPEDTILQQDVLELGSEDWSQDAYNPVMEDDPDDREKEKPKDTQGPGNK